MNNRVLKKLAVMIPALGIALAGLLGISSPAKAEDKPQVCETNCGLVGKSSFSLNDAQVVGGSEKVDGDIPGTTYTYSPDRKFRLVQGERMYVEYVGKDAITDYSGQPQKIPGSITLKWAKAAYENKTGELLDVEVTLSNISLRVADYTNEYTYDSDLEYLVDRFPLVFMYNNACDGRDGRECNSFDSDIRERLNPVLPSLVANTTLFTPGFEPSTLDLVDSTSHLTYKFFKHELDPETGERVESDQAGTLIMGYLNKPGMVGTPGNWSANWEQSDPMQPHVKILSEYGCLLRGDSRSLWREPPGVKFGKENPCKQAWSKEPDPRYANEALVGVNIKSGSTIELSNKEETGITLFDPDCAGHGYPGQLRISKDGEGDSVFIGKDSNGREVTKALNDSKVYFIYKVENIGRSPVWDIKVTDSKGVKVTCPKTVLVGGESMTCTGQGIVK